MIGEFFGYIALITAIIGLLPQVIKSYRTRSTDDISMIMLLNYFIGSVAWIIHGLSINSNFVVWSNILGGAVSLISIVQKLKYDNRYKRV